MAVGAGQPGAVPGEGIAPSTRLLTVTSAAMSGVRPTAPFHVNPETGDGGHTVYGDMPLVAPSVVAGSPRSSGVAQLDPLVQLVYGVLKTSGNWVEGRPAATSARPERGPNANMNVCVPSASVMKPSPPEICWHLMAPLAVVPVVAPAGGVGMTKPPCVPAGGLVVDAIANCVGPLYAGSPPPAPVTTFGWVIVVVGH